MKTNKHPRDLTAAETEALVQEFDEVAEDDYVVVQSHALAELRAAAAT